MIMYIYIKPVYFHYNIKYVHTNKIDGQQTNYIKVLWPIH